MIGNRISKVTAFCSKHKIFFFVSLTLVVAALVLGITRLKINDNIFSTLPEGESFDRLNQLLETKNLSNQVLFSIAVDENNDAGELLYELAELLKTGAGDKLRDITVTRDNAEWEAYEYFRSNFPFLIDSGYYLQMESKLHPDSVTASLVTVHRQLTTPDGAFTKNFVLNDPLFISAPFFRELSAGQSSSNFIMDEGILFSKDKKLAFLTAKTNFNSGQSEKNEELHTRLTSVTEEWNRAHPHNSMSHFGVFEIAAVNSAQVKQDTFITISLTLFSVLLIIIFYYRKLTIPLYFILPALFGSVFALGIAGFLKDEVSAVSIATSGVLIGIILDYSFHFFTHLKHTGSISATVKEISVPLLTGSFTTVTAFSALMFANSAVLQDFGLLAALSLTGSALFTLLGLPVILHSFSFDYKNLPDTYFFRMPFLSSRYRKIALAAIVLITFGFLVKGLNIEFDGDLKNLSFNSPELREKEKIHTGINPVSEKKLFLFVENTEPEKAEENNFELYRTLNHLENEGLVHSFVSAAPYVIPAKIKAAKAREWKSFWQQKQPALTGNFDRVADSLGFSGDAFANFKTSISTGPDTSASGSLPALPEIENLINREENKITYVSTVMLPTENIAEVKNALEKVPGVQIFDRSLTASALLDMVKNDFNYILVISSVIVFFTLLVIYGRIELTILAFLPMVISWIWIIGLAAALDIKFNFVNVVITTFIFGLGDDFSIFMTDGLLSKYKHGKDSLKSYSSAIFLSALTSIIGTGVLIFAKHPAIHSVALISVIGLSCILFISLVFQPILFDLFVQRRTEHKKAPVQLIPLLLTCISFILFTLGCLCMYAVSAVLFILPLSKTTKTRILNNMLSGFALIVIYSGVHVTKRITGKEHLDFSRPSVIIANHTSFLDILLLIMLNPKVIMMVKGWVYRSPFFGPIIRQAGYINSENGAEENLALIKERISAGYSPVIFPEGSRSEDDTIKRFHKGAFYLAQELNLPITPVVINGAAFTLPKKDFYIRSGTLDVKILPAIPADDTTWGETVRDRSKSISAYFREQHTAFKNTVENAHYLRHRLQSTYVYKGPVLEWYVKIKWKLEGKNFDFYNSLIGSRKRILDIGCGYGYLPLYLHYKGSDRLITGVDYDEEKILIAQNIYDKTDTLQFVAADAREITITEQDVIFLNDILHYLLPQERTQLLKKCADALAEGGIIIIRDGITTLDQRHKLTEKTEHFSTKIFGFNKTVSELSFFDENFIKQFAVNHDFSYEMIEQSRNTSNVLFLLRK